MKLQCERTLGLTARMEHFRLSLQSALKEIRAKVVVYMRILQSEIKSSLITGNISKVCPMECSLTLVLGSTHDCKQMDYLVTVQLLPQRCQ